MELPNEEWSKDEKPRRMGDVSLVSIVVCVLVLAFAALNRYLH